MQAMASTSDSHLIASTGPRKYMSKRQSACDFCRSRKSACQIETIPPCRGCIAHSKECTFTGYKVQRRKVIATRNNPLINGRSIEDRTTGGGNPKEIDASSVSPPSESGAGGLFYSEGNENIFLNSFQDLDQGWEAMFSSGMDNTIGLTPMDGSIDISMAHDGTAVSQDIDHRTRSQHLDDVQASISQHGNSSCSKIESQGQARSLDCLSDISPQLCGLTGDMDPYLLRRYQFDENSEFAFSKLTIRAIQDTAMPVQFLLSPNHLSSESRAETSLEKDSRSAQDANRAELDQLISPGVGNRLIQLFYRFIYPQFPILAYSDTPNPKSSSTHLLASIYCLAQTFATFDERLCIEFAYSAPSPQKLLNIAWRSFGHSLHSPTIDTIQAGLILLLQPPANELVLDSAFKWSLMGSVIASAQTLGLHLDATHWRLPSEETKLRKRLSWAVYTFDKWFALSLGRPSHISDDDWLVSELGLSDLESVQSEIETLLCRELSHLTRILSKVLRQLYSSKAVMLLTPDYQRTLIISRELLQELTSWYQNLSSYFHGDSPHKEPDARFSIHLCYHAVKITIIRALLRPFYHSGTTMPGNVNERTEWVSSRNNCRLGAKTAGIAAGKSVSMLRVSHYQSFWPPWCKTHFASITNLLLLLTITSPTDELDETLAALDQTRTEYRVQAKSFSLVRFALLRIDAVFWVGLDKVIARNSEPAC